MSIVQISLFLYAHYFYKKNDINKFIIILHKIFLIYMSINLISYIFFRNGIGTEKNLYFLGYRTRFTEYSFVLIVLSVLKYNIVESKSKKELCISILIAIINILLPKIATAIIGIIIIIFMFFILKKLKKVNYKLLGILAILINLSIIFFRIQNVFAFFIEDILNKSVDLTYRTNIWDQSYKYIFDNKIFFGHMYPIDGNFILWANTYWQAHNQILQLLYEVGIVGTVLFFHICLKALRNLNIENLSLNKNCIIIVGCIFFAFLIMMTTEIYSFYMPFYVLIIICLYCAEFKSYSK